MLDKRAQFFIFFISIALVFNTFLNTASAESPSVLRISVARVVADTGFMDYMVRQFMENNPEISLQTRNAGALTVLEHGQEGRADLVITHYPPEERIFILNGFGAERIQFMYSQFAVFGPHDNSLDISSASDFKQVFQLLKDEEVNMLVPSPRSGTYRKLEELWASAGINPDWMDYENTGASASYTLNQAAENGSYSFSDIGLFLINREQLASKIQPLFRDDTGFVNEVSAIVVNGNQVAGVQQDLAEKFLAFLISVDGQQAIMDFNEQAFGTLLYVPSAHNDNNVIKRNLQEQIISERRQRNKSIGIGVLVSLFALLSLALVLRNRSLDRENWAKQMQLEKSLHEQDLANQAEHAKSEFLANMSHEIRTPLNAVLGMARIGMRDTSERKSQESFKHILDSGEHLLGVINDILDYSRVESGKLTVESKPFQLMVVVENVVNLLAERARVKGLSLKLKIIDQLPDWVLGDPLRLQQILINLLSNAIKFTLEGEVTLFVSKENEKVYFQVVDTGIGINKEDIPRLFKPFEQADNTVTRKFGGSGLGLVISRNLAELMGGELNVESEQGSGSTFLLILPLQVTGSAAVKEHRIESRPNQQLAGIRVLVVDDVEINRLILEDLLEQEGAMVELAEDGKQAVDHLNERGTADIDIVLMDIQMPVMDGYEATGRILEMAPALPIIGVTAHALKEERDKCYAVGMVDHVTKPLDVDKIIAAILQHVVRSE